MMFSVVVPTYNRASLLADLLSSLSAQTFKGFEVLICDDGSTDNTAEVVKRFEPLLDIKYHYSDNWGGPARPRNLGIRHSIGDWICFLDSDDIWHKDKLLRCKCAIDETPSVGMMFHQFNVVQGDNVLRVIGQYSSDNRKYKNFKKLAAGGNKIVLSSICVKKGILDAVGGFSEDKELVGIEDYDLILRLSLQNVPFQSLSAVLGDYRLSLDNISSDELKQINKLHRMLSKYSSDFPDLLPASYVDSLKNYMLGGHFSATDKAKANDFLNSVIFGNAPLSLRLRAIYKRLI